MMYIIILEVQLVSFISDFVGERCNKVPLNYVYSHITLALSRLD